MARKSADEIAAEIREMIRSGALSPGDRLQSVEELMELHGVAKQTVRLALTLLKNEGLIEHRGGRAGNVVRERPAARMIRSRAMERDHLGYYSGSNVQHWRLVAGTRTEVSEGEPLPPEIAALLELPAGTPATVRRRLNGDPDVPQYRQLTDSWLHPEIVEELPILATNDTGLGGMYDRIEEWAQQPIAWEELVTAAMPSPAEAEALLLPAGVPLLRVFRTSTVKRGRRKLVFEVNDIRMSGEVFAVQYPMQRAASAKWPVPPATGDFYSS